jgi:hypothetical protein
MKRFSTSFRAIDKTDGSIKTFVGNDIYSSSQQDAEVYVKQYFPYLTILGEFVSEVDEFTGKEIDLRQN